MNGFIFRASFRFFRKKGFSWYSFLLHTKITFFFGTLFVSLIHSPPFFFWFFFQIISKISKMMFFCHYKPHSVFFYQKLSATKYCASFPRCFNWRVPRLKLSNQLSSCAFRNSSFSIVKKWNRSDIPVPFILEKI